MPYSRLRGEVRLRCSAVTEFAYLATPSGTLRLADVRRIADVLCKGGLAVLPTETGHMLAAVATDLAAVQRAFAAKKRDHAKAMHVACSSLSMATRFALLTPSAERVLGALTPGPVTVVVRRSSLLPDRLVTLDETVGIRVPDHPATLQVIAEVGAPLTATSLNESGSASVSPDRATLSALAWPDGHAVYVVDADAVPAYSAPSTLVRLLGADVEILRPGPISAAEIRSVLEQPAD
jgi:L-threonylcarbamoyladenylate synthase